ncbi:hypothetical protein LIA77_03841 [Sarocladium implicatum]|nr:hypothetical protein LIA77_03841 [Sarocladium implicatum]
MKAVRVMDQTGMLHMLWHVLRHSPHAVRLPNSAAIGPQVDRRGTPQRDPTLLTVPGTAKKRRRQLGPSLTPLSTEPWHLSALTRSLRVSSPRLAASNGAPSGPCGNHTTSDFSDMDAW